MRDFKSIMTSLRVTVNMFIAITIVGLSMPSLAGAATRAEFPLEYVEHGINLELQGVGLKKVVFIKAFEAGYYKEAGANLLTGAKNIRVNYFVKIPGYKLSNFTIKSMKNNISVTEFNALESEIEQMKKYFVDLKPGDMYELLYIPKVGTKFVHNGNVVGVITGDKFAEAIYSVWIGDKPFDDKLKEKILGANAANNYFVKR